MRLPSGCLAWAVDTAAPSGGIRLRLAKGGQTLNAEDPQSPYEHLSRAARRHALILPLVRTLGLTVAVFVLYFTLPFDNTSWIESGLALLVGLVAVACLLAWHTRQIAQSPYPRVRAIEALATTFPIFILIFSTTYFVMDTYSTGSYSQTMTRVDALYFAVTVFSTVGFGDITPVSEPARIIVTVQMFLDLLLVGLVVRILFQSVQTGLARRDSGADDR